MAVDVVIAGGGPNGLMLACELRLAGVRPVVLERLPARSDLPKANGLVGRVVQALELRGLYEPLAGRAGPPEPVPFYQFSGIPLDLRGLEGNPLHVLPVAQPRIEQVLEERALELGVEIRRGHELTSLRDDGTDVDLAIRGPEGAYRLRTRYLVGADGGHSLVRKEVDIAFPGTTDDSFVSRAGHAVIPEALLDPVTGALDLPGLDAPLRPYTQNRLAHGVFSFAMMPPGSGVHLVAVLEWDRPPADEATPMTFAELRESVRRVLGTDLPMEEPVADEPHLLRRLTGVSSRQAEAYRAGRVLLLGDAAHVHSAIGGPGLNLGMLDAMNLGWKLAAEIAGWAPEGLLDTYEAERAPASRRVLMQTRTQMALMRPGEDLTAARDLIAELFESEVNRRRIAALLAGADIQYDMGHDAPHLLPGQWLPDMRSQITAGRKQLAEALRGARPVLLDFTEDASAAALAEGWKDRIDIVTENRHADQALPASALLIRPDGYVAWAGALTLPDQDQDQNHRAHRGLRLALTTWFGAAAGLSPR